MIKKEHHQHEVLPRYYIFLCVCLIFYLAASNAPISTDEPTQPKPDWSVVLFEIASQHLDFPIPAIQEAMRDIQIFTGGGSLSWPECKDVSIQVNLRPVVISGLNLMAITDNTHIRSISETGQITIEAEWLLATWLWSTWEAQRPEALWHELFHLRQICRLMAEVDRTQGLEVANQQFITILRAHRAEMEAEVLGSQAYWYLTTLDQDIDPILQGSVNEKGETLLSIWTNLYLAENDDILALDGVGVPSLSAHAAWNDWVARVNEIYVGPLLPLD